MVLGVSLRVVGEVLVFEWVEDIKGRLRADMTIRPLEGIEPLNSGFQHSYGVAYRAQGGSTPGTWINASPFEFCGSSAVGTLNLGPKTWGSQGGLQCKILCPLGGPDI